MRYIILAKGQHEEFTTPRQLTNINGERLLDRTIRLLKENGIKDILVTGNYKDLDAKVIDPEGNTYNYNTNKGYWLDAFSGLLEKPTCFIWGDVYFSESAIKTIVEGKEDTFYCSYQNHDERYIKPHDEPFAYKVAGTKRFSEHIEKLKRMYDKGQTIRNPIIWELYRSLNGIGVNTHIIKDNVVIINDITCDIDNIQDVYKLRYILGGNMVRFIAKEEFTCSKWDDIKEIVRANPGNNEKNKVHIGDIVLCTNELAKYLKNELDIDYKPGNNPMGRAIKIDIIEVIPEEKKVEPKEEKKEVKKAPVKKTTKKKVK